mmetsp:Transcript_21399/g.49386  ORF Transcript_21399/g.49386 Transcript_21399/m.49386 type:complete len:87 (+) Transcript_21399:75-335(+)
MDGYGVCQPHDAIDPDPPNLAHNCRQHEKHNKQVFPEQIAILVIDSIRVFSIIALHLFVSKLFVDLFALYPSLFSSSSAAVFDSPK